MVASTNRMSPPTGVQASPVATPGRSIRSATSSRNRGRPRYSATVSAVTRTGPASPSASRRATLRTTVAISRSRFRTPASRV